MGSVTTIDSDCAFPIVLLVSDVAIFSILFFFHCSSSSSPGNNGLPPPPPQVLPPPTPPLSMQLSTGLNCPTYRTAFWLACGFWRSRDSYFVDMMVLAVWYCGVVFAPGCVCGPLFMVTSVVGMLVTEGNG